MIENEVFIELNKFCDEVTYIKENYEIDFRCNDTLYKVSYKMEDEKTRQREIRVFESFDKKNEYKHKLITYDETNSLGEIEIIKYEDFIFKLDDVLITN